VMVGTWVVVVDGSEVMTDNIPCWRKCAPGFARPAVGKGGLLAGRVSWVYLT
jgi:hypothetical protein